MMELSEGERNVTIHSVLTECQYVTDGRADGEKGDEVVTTWIN